MAERFFKATGERELRISVLGKIWMFKPDEVVRVADDRASSYFVLHKGLREVSAAGVAVTPDAPTDSPLTKKTFKSGLSPKAQGLPSGVRVANFNGRQVVIKADGTFDIPKDMQTSASDKEQPAAATVEETKESKAETTDVPPKTGPRSKKKFEPPKVVPPVATKTAT